jgi:hypothetical protein
MKKFYVIFALLSLVVLTVHAQPQLSWRFNNAEVINAGTQLQFDVEVKASVAGSYQRDLQIYFDYNTLGFGSNIVANGKITYSPLTLMDATKYVVVNMADNTSSKFAIITEAINEMTQPGSATYYKEVTTTYQGVLRFTITIAGGGNTQLAGIAFDQTLMNGGQYYQSTSNTDPIKYMDPSLYENNLSSLKLSSFYGTTVYAKATPVVLNGCTVDMYSGATLIDTYATGTANIYYFTGMADGGYTLKGTSSKPYGGLQALDAIQVQRFVSGSLTFTDLQKRAADVNLSSSVQNLDATFIRRRVSSIPVPQWTAPNWIFDGPFGTPPALQGYPITVASGLGTAVFKALCSGDVNASYTPPAE